MGLIENVPAFIVTVLAILALPVSALVVAIVAGRRGQ